MNRIRATIVFAYLMAIGSASILFYSCKEKSSKDMLIVTLGNIKENTLNTTPSDSRRYLFRTQLVSLDPGKSNGSSRILTADFYSARSPKISFDGKNLLFSACKNQGEPYQIWEMNLEDLKSHQITSSDMSCSDPAYLPAGRIVFSKLSQNDTLKAQQSLFVCKLDGSNLKRITFNPATYFSTNVLKDGRILTLSGHVFPEKQDPVFVIMRPDGTKADMFYQSGNDSYITGPGFETGSGKIVFMESEKHAGNMGKLIAISYNRPLHSREELSSGTDGEFKTVFSMRSGKLLVSYRKSEKERFALCEFDIQKKSLGRTIFNAPESDVLEVAEAGSHEIPKNLPSEVDMGVKTGLIMCQDINMTRNQNTGIKGSLPMASRVEIVGLDSILGIVDVAADGSFYLKVIADKPFRLQTIDGNGKVVDGPCGWIWLRPNERRGCVGCHQDPEMVPGNKVPLAVHNAPVNIPMHINKIVEKKVSLE